MVYLGKLSPKSRPRGNREIPGLTQCMTAKWHILFGGVSSAVHFVTLVIGGEVAMASSAADGFVLQRAVRGCEMQARGESEANGDDLGEEK